MSTLAHFTRADCGRLGTAQIEPLLPTSKGASSLDTHIQLIDFWWTEDQIPWPKKETLGQRLNLSDKQIQRLVRDLERRGFVKRVVRKTRHGRTSNGYDLAGLVVELQKLAPEFAEAADAKRKVERRGGLKQTVRG